MSLDPVTRDPASEREIAAILMGRAVRPARPERFASVAVHHQVASLLVSAGACGLLPPDAAARLMDEARRQAALTALREPELVRVLRGLRDAGLAVLLMKGAHLAQTHYPLSWLRPRHDTDLLIRAAEAGAAADTLARLGYRRQSVQTGGEVLGQMMFDREDIAGAVLDVHWRVSARPLAAGLLDPEDLFARAVPVPALGAHARAPSSVDALALACLHQVAHHPGHDLLVWLYDVHLLLQGFADGDAETFVDRARARGMARICLLVIENAASHFPSRRAADVMTELEAVSGYEPAAVTLAGRRTRLADALLDVRARSGWAARLRLVAGHLFPPAPYMRATYAPGSRAPLWWLYLTRLLRGAPRWLRRPPTAS